MIERAVTICMVAGALMAWAQPQATPAGPCVISAGPTTLPALPETSGLAMSRRDATRLWSHNDSGNASLLFALDTTGAPRGTVRVPIRTRDWEDISAGTCPSGVCLYLADIGDNARTRKSVQIYRIPEPQPGQTDTAQPEVFTATYADGPHNAEAMFVIGRNLFIVTKDRAGGVYQAALSDSRDLTFRRIGQLKLENVTDAEASPDEASVVVRTSHDVAIYRTDTIVRGGNTPYLRMSVAWLQEPQGEGVAIQGNTLYLSSEGGSPGMPGRFVALRCSIP